MQSLKGIEFCRTLAEAGLESGRSVLGLLDRRPRQPVLDALLVREHDGPDLDVEIMPFVADHELDLAGDRDRHRGTTRIEVGDVENRTGLPLALARSTNSTQRVRLSSPRPVTTLMP